MSEGKYCKIGGAIKTITGEYTKIGGAIKQGTINAIEIGGAIKQISVAGRTIFTGGEPGTLPDQFWAISSAPATQDGWPVDPVGMSDIRDVACDEDGNSYWAAGNLVYKVELDGTVAWSIAHNGVNAIAVDSNGYVYHGDYVGGAGGIIKTDPDGNHVWTTTFTLPMGSVNSLCVALADNKLYAGMGIGGAGAVYRLHLNSEIPSLVCSNVSEILSVATVDGSLTVYYGTLAGQYAKYPVGGPETWHVNNAGSDIQEIRTAHDGYGYCAMGATGYIRKFLLSSGTAVWSSAPSPALGNATGVAVDDASHAYGLYHGGGVNDRVIRKLNSAGVEQWTWQPQAGAELYGIAVMPGEKSAGF